MNGIYGMPKGSSINESKYKPILPIRRAWWVGEWSAIGTDSSINEPIVNSWSVPKTSTQNPAIAWEFPISRNLTHVAIRCDNSTQVAASSLSYPLYCEYSSNGVSWYRLPTPAVMVSYFANASETPTDTIQCYFWIPPNNIYAKYWRLAIPLDEFVSDYDDNEWHYSLLKPGALDIHTKYSHNLNQFNDVISDVWNSHNLHMPWVNASFFIYTGVRLTSLIIIKMGTSTTSDGMRKFILTDDNLNRIKRTGNYTDIYHRAVPVHTENGFIVGVGQYNNDSWDANYSYSFSSSILYSNYKAFGFVSDINQKSIAEHVITINNRINNKLEVKPDTIMMYSGISTNWLITHPAESDRSYNLSSSSGFTTPSVLYTDNKNIVFPRVDSAKSETIIYYASQTDSFKCGTYVGNGLSGNEITGIGFMPSIIIVMRRDGTQAGVLVIDSLAISTSYGTSYSDRTIRAINDGFRLDNVHAACNSSSVDYLYWAWK